MSSKLVWMDLEMTGLDPKTDVIIEIATIVTDENLNILEIGPEMAVTTTEAQLAGMDEWCQTHHSDSGLIERVRATKEDHRSAELATLEFIRKFVAKGESPLCGNSIHQDRKFLTNYMPELEDYMHYRNIDVSTVKELYKRWYPSAASFKKENKHTALEDIKESIAELQFYREQCFLG